MRLLKYPCIWFQFIDCDLLILDEDIINELVDSAIIHRYGIPIWYVTTIIGFTASNQIANNENYSGISSICIIYSRNLDLFETLVLLILCQSGRTCAKMYSFTVCSNMWVISHTTVRFQLLCQTIQDNMCDQSIGRCPYFVVLKSGANKFWFQIYMITTLKWIIKAQKFGLFKAF